MLEGSKFVMKFSPVAVVVGTAKLVNIEALIGLDSVVVVVLANVGLALAVDNVDGGCCDPTLLGGIPGTVAVEALEYGLAIDIKPNWLPVLTRLTSVGSVKKELVTAPESLVDATLAEEILDCTADTVAPILLPMLNCKVLSKEVAGIGGFDLLLLVSVLLMPSLVKLSC